VQQIIFGEFKFGHLLQYEEAFSEEKIAYEKTKVTFLILILFNFMFLLSNFSFFGFFSHFKFHKMISILMEMMELLMEV
jgi:hypothetical protein